MAVLERKSSKKWRNSQQQQQHHQSHRFHREWCARKESELISHFVGNIVSCSIKSRFLLTSILLEVQETHLQADVTTNFVEWDGMGWSFWEVNLQKLMC